MVADGQDIAVITVSEIDAKKRFVPDANDEVTFSIEGPGKIIGVGNGDPSSHEADKYIDDITAIVVTDWKVKTTDAKDSTPEFKTQFDETEWSPGFTWQDDNNKNYHAKIYHGKFIAPENIDNASITLFVHSVGDDQNIYINGQLLARNLAGSPSGHEIKLAPSLLKVGENFITIVSTPYRNARKGGEFPVSLQVTKRAEPWKRKLFNGLSQVIIQSTEEPGEIVLKAVSGNMSSEIKIPTRLPAAKP
jgi:beta-galactosidase